MAIKKVISHDYQKLGLIKDALLNPLTTSAKNTLAATLGAGHKGLAVYDTDLFRIEFWDGDSFEAVSSTTSGLTPQGSVAFNATEPASPSLGDLYVFTSAGTNTWEGSTVVQVGDQVWWDGTAWNFIQGNVIAATETVSGIAEIATQGETNTGTDDARFITPLKLASNQTTKAFAKTYFATGLTLVANTPLTINHALQLQNRDSYILSFKDGNSTVEIDDDSVDINNCTITSNVAVAGTGVVTVIGF